MDRDPESPAGRADDVPSSAFPSGAPFHYTPQGGGDTVVFTYDCPPKPTTVEPGWTIEHDREKRVLRLAARDGKTDAFGDRATRYLMVEPDTDTCELVPIMRDGKPRILYLCREEREVG